MITRPRYLSWDDYFMALAFLSAERSKDPNKQVRARLPDVPCCLPTPTRGAVRYCCVKGVLIKCWACADI